MKSHPSLRDPAIDFQRQFNSVAIDVEALLERILRIEPVKGEIARPKRLLEAMRYSTLNGGKRLRPFLVVAVGDLFAVPRSQSLLAGAALECVHCYSLIHDDLPSMDNDDLRRGRPALHRAFDEATAILAGDGLLTLAFELLARPEIHSDHEVRVELIAALARAAGLGGMVGGQILDLAAEGRFGASLSPPSGLAEIENLQAMKTGALLNVACLAGAILGQANAPARANLARYGSAIGLAFQISDDLLDVEGSAENVGKAVHKDQASGKATLIGSMGIEAARQRLLGLIQAAETSLTSFGRAAEILVELAKFIAARKA